MATRTGKARRAHNDNKHPGEPCQIPLSGNPLRAAHGYEFRALPAVRRRRDRYRQPGTEPGLL
ncbi:hypothetical protein [Streptomyces turgidiscabies]|uniref:Uncharacterized protein n=1 Tax=Streptomyces turgidiscabies TaxID=85558 RepID=A0ABU0RGX9_9ACTN|nr:hypothetical protein [Streptomyces turgidiscabies]MDQ0930240.1 hypothetical protein [Streptomyces turgidiscabies]